MDFPAQISYRDWRGGGGVRTGQFKYLTEIMDGRYGGGSIVTMKGLVFIGITHLAELITDHN
jgi:hypothetical protein